MLREVHGHPELHPPQTQDVRANGVITICTTHRHAYECDVECYEYAEAIIESETLATELEARLKEAPDPKRSTGSFEPVKGVKEVPLDPSSSNSKTMRVATALDPKYEAVLVDFLCMNSDMFAWSPLDMLAIPREVTVHSLDIRAGSKLVRQ
jgi:hypothetical protein